VAVDVVTIVAGLLLLVFASSFSSTQQSFFGRPSTAARRLDVVAFAIVGAIALGWVDHRSGWLATATRVRQPSGQQGCPGRRGGPRARALPEEVQWCAQFFAPDFLSEVGPVLPSRRRHIEGHRRTLVRALSNQILSTLVT
jgi:hypothetical protein